MNLFYWDQCNNFGDQISNFITSQIINKDKYNLVFNQKNETLNIVCVGSYIHVVCENTFVFGAGIRTPDNKEKRINIQI